MYTSVAHVPHDLTWRASNDVLLRLLEYFQPSTIDLVGFKDVLDADEDEPARSIYRSEKLGPAEAIRAYSSRRCVTAMFMVNCRAWSRRIEASIGAIIPAQIADGYVAWDVNCTVGPRVLWDKLQENRLFTTQFALTISGDGMPTDLGRYLELFLTTPEAQQLSAFLEELTGQPWQPLISANF